MSEARTSARTPANPPGEDARSGGEGEEWLRVVGLAYDPKDGPPRVMLKAAGPLAEQVLAARDPRQGPQVVRNEALLQSLYRLPMDSPIGAELFHVVAAILAHVFAVDAEMKEVRK